MTNYMTIFVYLGIYLKLTNHISKLFKSTVFLILGDHI